MRPFVISDDARQDIADALQWSREYFGESAQLRYEALLVQAMQDVAEDPCRPGSHAHPEITEFTRTYHLRNSRFRVSRAVGRVKDPCHFLLYEATLDSDVVVGRVLHERMEPRRHG